MVTPSSEVVICCFSSVFLLGFCISMKKASSELSLLSEVHEEPEQQSVPFLETPPRLRSPDRTSIAPAPYAAVVARSPLSSLPVPIATHKTTRQPSP